jgi:5-methylcytosine-specific restriction endonuclease McrA
MCKRCVRSRRRARYAADPRPDLARNAEYARAHPEVVAKAQRQRNERERAKRAPAIRRVTAEQQRERRRRWKARNRARILAQERARYHRNRARARAKERRRRDYRVIGRDAEAVAYAAVLRADPCAYCGGTGGALDHIVAVERGGANDWTNVTATCRSCNSRKHTHSLLKALLRAL